MLIAITLTANLKLLLSIFTYSAYRFQSCQHNDWLTTRSAVFRYTPSMPFKLFHTDLKRSRGSNERYFARVQSSFRVLIKVGTSKKDHHLCLILFSIFNKLIGKRNLVLSAFIQSRWGSS